MLRKCTAVDRKPIMNQKNPQKMKKVKRIKKMMKLKMPVKENHKNLLCSKESGCLKRKLMYKDLSLASLQMNEIILKI